MNLCSDDHEEICFEGRKCPCCDKMSDMQRTIDDLEKELEFAKDELRQIEST